MEPESDQIPDQDFDLSRLWIRLKETPTNNFFMHPPSNHFGEPLSNGGILIGRWVLLYAYVRLIEISYGFEKITQKRKSPVIAF